MNPYFNVQDSLNEFWLLRARLIEWILAFTCKNLSFSIPSRYHESISTCMLIWLYHNLRPVFQLNPNQLNRWVIKSSLSINQTTNNWMKAKINTQEVEVYSIKIDYIKPGHEGVQLLRILQCNSNNIYI